MAEFVVLRLDQTGFALPASAVTRIVQAVEITPLPQAPAIILGVINVHGSIIPVIDFRKRFGLPHRDTALSDRLVIARTERRSLALLVDAVDDVVDFSQSDITDPAALVSDLEQVSGIARSSDGIIFIHDLERFLTGGEAASLDDAMATLGHGADGH